MADNINRPRTQDPWNDRSLLLAVDHNAVRVPKCPGAAIAGVRLINNGLNRVAAFPPADAGNDCHRPRMLKIAVDEMKTVWLGYESLMATRGPLPFPRVLLRAPPPPLLRQLPDRHLFGCQ